MKISKYDKKEGGKEAGQTTVTNLIHVSLHRICSHRHDGCLLVRPSTTSDDLCRLHSRDDETV